MKTLKINFSILIFVSIALISGCSENLISSGETKQDVSNNAVSKNSFSGNVYSAQIKLSPGETLNLNYSNSNLILIHSYTISNCSIDKKDLRIRSSNQAGSESLPCNWKKSGNFAFEDLSVTNIGLKTRVVSVYLEGVTLND